MSLDGARIELISLMGQVVGETCVDLNERSERCFVLLTVPQESEAAIVLIVEDAHLVTDQSLRYLDLVASLGRSGRVPLQIVLVGDPAIWERLPPTGSLSVARGAMRVALLDDPAEDSVVAEAGGLEVAETTDPAAYPQHRGHERDSAPTIGDFSGMGELDIGGVAAAATREAGPVTQRATSTLTESEPSAEVVEMVSAPLSMVEPARKKRRRIAFAACVGAVVTGGGLAADALVYNPLSSAGIIQSIALDQPATAAEQSDQFVSSDTAAAAPSQSPAASETAAPDAAELANVSVSGQVSPSGDGGLANPNPDEQALAPASSAVPGSERAGTAPPPPADQTSAPDVTRIVAPTTALATVPVASFMASREASEPSAPRTDDLPQVARPDMPAAAPSGFRAVSAARASTPSTEAPDRAARAESFATAGSVTVSPSISPALAAILIERGDGLLATGDVTGARLMYQRAAGGGAARGAVALGMSYDPVFLVRIGAGGVAADPQRAMAWYRRAADLGSAEAIRLVASLQPGAAD